MPVLVTCSRCSAKLKVPDIAAGKSIKCPKCSATINVPAAEAAPAEVAPVAAVQAEPPLVATAKVRRRDEDDRPSRRDRRDDDDDYDRPRRRWRRRDLEETGDSSSSNGMCMGLGIGSICLGVIAGIFAFIPCCGAVVAFPAGGIGLLLGLIGLSVAFMASHKSVGALILTIAGSVVNIGAIGIALLWWIYFGVVASTSPPPGSTFSPPPRNNWPNNGMNLPPTPAS